MRDDEFTGRNDPGYRKLAFIAEIGPKLGYADDQEIFWIDDRSDRPGWTLRQVREHVEQWTKQIELEEELD